MLNLSLITTKYETGAITEPLGECDEGDRNFNKPKFFRIQLMFLCLRSSELFDLAFLSISISGHGQFLTFLSSSQPAGSTFESLPAWQHHHSGSDIYFLYYYHLCAIIPPSVLVFSHRLPPLLSDIFHLQYSTLLAFPDLLFNDGDISPFLPTFWGGRSLPATRGIMV